MDAHAIVPLVSAIAWATVEAAIRAWVVAASGLAASNVIWEGEKGARPTTPYISLSIPDLVGVGSDFRTTEDAPSPAPGAEILVRAHGHRVATLQLQCFAGDDELGGAPLQRLSDVLSALPMHYAALDTAGVGIGSAAPVALREGRRGGIFEARAVTSVQLHLGSEVVGYQTYVERMQVTTTAKNAGGDVVAESEQWIPDPPVET